MIEFSVVIDSDDTEELVDALNHIIGLLQDGFTSGYEPSWSVDVTPEVDWDFVDSLN